MNGKEEALFGNGAVRAHVDHANLDYYIEVQRDPAPPVATVWRAVEWMHKHKLSPMDPTAYDMGTYEPRGDMTRYYFTSQVFGYDLDEQSSLEGVGA